jgi:hypothetical protein
MAAVMKPVSRGPMLESENAAGIAVRALGCMDWDGIPTRGPESPYEQKGQCCDVSAVGHRQGHHPTYRAPV